MALALMIELTQLLQPPFDRHHAWSVGVTRTHLDGRPVEDMTDIPLLARRPGDARTVHRADGSAAPRGYRAA